tara:strand:- start:288 stop:512 length:225 start_codon:yes stop_codon:yes gene_type:complete
MNIHLLIKASLLRRQWKINLLFKYSSLYLVSQAGGKSVGLHASRWKLLSIGLLKFSDSIFWGSFEIFGVFGGGS